MSNRAKRSDLYMKHFSLDLLWSTEGEIDIKSRYQSRYQETHQEAHTVGPGGGCQDGEKGTHLRAVGGGGLVKLIIRTQPQPPTKLPSSSRRVRGRPLQLAHALLPADSPNLRQHQTPGQFYKQITNHQTISLPHG